MKFASESDRLRLRCAAVFNLVLFFLACAASAATPAAPTSRPADAERILGDVTKFDSVKSVVISNDARHLAFLGVRGAKQYVVANGQEGPAFDWIVPDSMFVLAEGRSAYLVQTDTTTAAVIAGRADKPYSTVAYNRLFVSPDGREVAYIATLDNKKMSIVFGGQEGPSFDAIDFPLFSPDSKHLAYRAMNNGLWQIVLDGKAQPAYDAAVGISMSFSPDSQHIAYEAVRKTQHVIVIDGKEAMPCNTLRAGPGFSPDSRRWAAAMNAHADGGENDQVCVAVDRKIGRTYDAVYAGDIRFSPDSRHFAFAARRGRQSLIVLDGVDKPPVDDVGSRTLLFSPDSAHIAYAAMSGGKQMVVLDTTRQKPWEAIQAGTPLFSPDSKRLAYVATQGVKWTEVVDGQESPEWDLSGVPIFSPDSRHFAYRALQGKRAVAVIDGIATPEVDGVTPIAFSPDSRHTVYVSKSAGISRICVDGVPSVASYDLNVPDEPAVFDDLNTAHLIALRAGKFLLVTIRIPAGK